MLARVVVVVVNSIYSPIKQPQKKTLKKEQERAREQLHDISAEPAEGEPAAARERRAARLQHSSQAKQSPDES